MEMETLWRICQGFLCDGGVWCGIKMVPRGLDEFNAATKAWIRFRDFVIAGMNLIGTSKEMGTLISKEKQGFGRTQKGTLEARFELLLFGVPIEFVEVNRS